MKKWKSPIGSFIDFFNRQSKNIMTNENEKIFKFIKENVSEETSKIFFENEINEETFLELTEEDLKEMGITKVKIFKFLFIKTSSK